MRSEAEEALAANPDLNCPGFESSRVFALLDKWLRSPPSGLTRKSLLRNVNTVFQFVVLPTEPIDQSNPRTRPTKSTSGGALRPALWYVDLKRTAGIAKGYPPKGILGVRKRADVVIECSELAEERRGRCPAERSWKLMRPYIRLPARNPLFFCCQPIETCCTWPRDSSTPRSSTMSAG